jgi:ABC-2 type transport system ATP-binding protein
MESWWNKKVEDLSKGMSQKLQFVTTVLHEPKLIILYRVNATFLPSQISMVSAFILHVTKNRDVLHTYMTLNKTRPA